MNCLFIGAHPDDVEIGCGGTIAKKVYKGEKVYALCLSGALGSNNESRIIETKTALKKLGVSYFDIKKYADRSLYHNFNLIVSDIEKIVQRLSPKRVYVHSAKDLHQDHMIANQATLIACRKVSEIFFYEAPSTMPSFSPNYFENITAFVNLKYESLCCHKSQNDKFYMKKEYILNRASFWGTYTPQKDKFLESSYEAFEIYRGIGE